MKTLSGAAGSGFTRSDLVRLLIGVFLFVTVICPLAVMLANMAKADVSAVLRAPRFRESLANSVYAAGTATVISIALAWVFAVVELLFNASLHVVADCR